MTKLTQKDVRTKVWRHNGLLGNVAMARRAMVTIGTVTTTTDEAKDLAYHIERDLLKLAGLLKTRID